MQAEKEKILKSAPTASSFVETGPVTDTKKIHGFESSLGQLDKSIEGAEKKLGFAKKHGSAKAKDEDWRSEVKKSEAGIDADTAELERLTDFSKKQEPSSFAETGASMMSSETAAVEERQRELMASSEEELAKVDEVVKRQRATLHSRLDELAKEAKAFDPSDLLQHTRRYVPENQGSSDAASFLQTLQNPRGKMTSDEKIADEFKRIDAVTARIAKWHDKLKAESKRKHVLKLHPEWHHKKGQPHVHFAPSPEEERREHKDDTFSQKQNRDEAKFIKSLDNDDTGPAEDAFDDSLLEVGQKVGVSVDAGGSLRTESSP